MAKSVLHTIEDNLSTFSKGQKRIGRYILDHYDQAAFMTASKLGKLTEVSESTVVRFAAELGFDGYPAMQKALQEMARNRLTSTQRIQAAENIYDRDVLSSVLQADIENLRQISMDEDRDTFQTAVEKIVHARHIYILGARSSTHLAGYLYFYMQMIFENVTLVQASAAGEIFEQLFRIGPEDVMIAISFPGTPRTPSTQPALPGPVERRSSPSRIRSSLRWPSCPARRCWPPARCCPLSIP